MSLENYRQKRDFERSPEPAGGEESEEGPLRFVVQMHDATRLHYDLRLELGGALKSWAVPKGPSLMPGDKRLAVMVEDHPMDYRNFEGVIPEGNYGAGPVMIWDEGFYCSKETCSREENERILAQGLKKGHISIVLNGQKLHGRFALAKIQGAEEENSWLLFKGDDEYASERDVLENDRSVRSGRTIEEIREGARAAGEVWLSPSERLKGIDLSVAPEAPMPHDVKPMLATLVDEPFDRQGWIFEIKWDGYRAIAEVGRGRLRLYSRNLQPFNDRFPVIQNALPDLGLEAVLDGEIVVVDEKGVSQFQLLQGYLRNQRGRLVYYVFDLLYLEGHDLRELPLIRRKEILRQALPDNPYIKYSDYIDERGEAFFDAAAERGLEGVVGKKADGPYRTGVRSKEWLKVRTRLRQEFVIGGFTEPRGSRTGFGALVLGVFDGDQLEYVGHAGSGLDVKGLIAMREKLEACARDSSPFRIPPKTNMPVHWIEPEYVVEVAFTGWTEDGLLRHPVILGLREDKPARDVRREYAQSAPIGKEEPTFPTAKQDQEIIVGERTLKVTNLNKVFWPDEGYTKGDLINYYRQIAPVILPYLRDRPESLNRHPNGIYGENFYHKNIEADQAPDWIPRVRVRSEGERRFINYLLCQEEAALVFLANLGCIELNPWNSRAEALDNPDYLIIDLDPGDIPFDAVIETALAVREVLDEAGIPGYPKTSGATGIHIYIPLGAAYDYDHARDFGKLIAVLAHRKVPKISSVERRPSKRPDKVYLDFLQNRRGQTLAAAYCLRPRPGATVSTPLTWDEVSPGLDPRDFTINTIFDRLDDVGDLFAPVLGQGIDIAKSLDRLAASADAAEVERISSPG